MKKFKLTKGKLAALVAAGCMVVALPVMAFNDRYNYAMDGYDSEYIAGVWPTKSVVYLNTRPASGGDVQIILDGAAKASATFPYRTSRADWKVTVTSGQQLDIWGHSLSSSTTYGVLHVWD